MMRWPTPCSAAFMHLPSRPTRQKNSIPVRKLPMTLNKTRVWVLLAAFAAAPAFAQNIAVVNGTPIPKARVDALVEQLVHQGQQDSPQLQAAVRQELVNREILMPEEARRGIPA